MYKYLFAFFFLPIILFAQEPQPISLEFSNQASHILNPDDYKQNSIYHGFQWSGTPAMDEALGNNLRTSGNIHAVNLKANIFSHYTPYTS